MKKLLVVLFLACSVSVWGQTPPAAAVPPESGGESRPADSLSEVPQVRFGDLYGQQQREWERGRRLPVLPPLRLKVGDFGGAGAQSAARAHRRPAQYPAPDRHVALDLERSGVELGRLSRRFPRRTHPLHAAAALTGRRPHGLFSGGRSLLGTRGKRRAGMLFFASCTVYFTYFSLLKIGKKSLFLHFETIARKG